jgi:hypothetical protein
VVEHGELEQDRRALCRREGRHAGGVMAARGEHEGSTVTVSCFSVMHRRSQ